MSTFHCTSQFEEMCTILKKKEETRTEKMKRPPDERHTQIHECLTEMF